MFLSGDSGRSAVVKRAPPLLVHSTKKVIERFGVVRERKLVARYAGSRRRDCSAVVCLYVATWRYIDVIIFMGV